MGHCNGESRLKLTVICWVCFLKFPGAIYLISDSVNSSSDEIGSEQTLP